jgi:hypothetical protein
MVYLSNVYVYQYTNNTVVLSCAHTWHQKTMLSTT